MNRWLVGGALGLLSVAAGVVLSSLLAGSSAAPQQTPNQPVDWADLPDLGSMVLRLALGTVAVLGLCALTLWAGKRRQRAAANSIGGTGLRILETLPLGNRCFVHLVQVGTGHALVGMDRTGCKRMLVLSEPLEGDMDDGGSGLEA